MSSILKKYFSIHKSLGDNFNFGLNYKRENITISIGSIRKNKKKKKKKPAKHQHKLA